MRLITIDLDETVWPCTPVILRAEERLHSWLMDRAPRLAEAQGVESLREHRARLRERRPDLAHDLTALRRESLAELLESYGYHRDWADGAIRLFLNERNRVEPFDDVLPVLRTLARRYRLISITNGNADVARTPLRGQFDYSLRAAEVGAAKPAPNLFEEALRHAAVAPAEAVHVGDDPYLDVEPARRLGMHTVWVNRAQAHWPPGLAPADAVVTEFYALERWLKTFG